LKIKVVEYGLNDAIKDIERLRDEAGRILISELERLRKIEAAAFELKRINARWPLANTFEMELTANTLFNLLPEVKQ